MAYSDSFTIRAKVQLFKIVWPIAEVVKEKKCVFNFGAGLSINNRTIKKKIDAFFFFFLMKAKISSVLIWNICQKSGKCSIQKDFFSLLNSLMNEFTFYNKIEFIEKIMLIENFVEIFWGSVSHPLFNILCF